MIVRKSVFGRFLHRISLRDSEEFQQGTAAAQPEVEAAGKAPGGEADGVVREEASSDREGSVAPVRQ